MSTTIKQSAPAQVPNNKAGSPSVQAGNNPVVGNPLDSTGYIPSGILIALILRALREAQDNDLQIQHDQAKEEQEYYKVLGGIGHKPSDGIIARAAQAIVDQGDESAQGLMLQGYSSAANAVISGGMAGVALTGGIYHQVQSDGIEGDITTLKNQNQALNGTPDGDNIIGKAGMNTDSEFGTEMQEFKNGSPVNSSQDAAEGLKVDSQEDLAEAKEARDKQIAEKEKALQKQQDGINRFMTLNQTVSTVSGSATQAAGNIMKAPHDLAAAQEQATGDVTKNLQQMDASSASNFQQNAHDKAQQALQVSDQLAQVAASSVQMRG